MTDRLDCPECGGAGEQRIGSLRLRCQFCLGAGYVGDDNEPIERGKGIADGEEYNPTKHGPLPSPRDHPAVKGSGLCPGCLGSRVVALDDNGMIEQPCPVCQ